MNKQGSIKMRNDLQEAVDILSALNEHNALLAPKGIAWADGRIHVSKKSQEAMHRSLPIAIAALREKAERKPDPDTGLVLCGCGGEAKVWPSDLRQAMVTAYQVGCIKCATTTVWVRGKQENAVKVWNTAMGYPSRPGAIVPDAGEMAPNGDENA